MNAEIEKTGVQQDTGFEHLIAVVETGRDEELEEAVASLHPADVAELINLLERFESKNRVFRVLAPDVAPAVLSLVSPLARERIVQDLSVDQLGQIVQELDSDDAADLLGSVRRSVRRAFWPACQGRCQHGSSSCCATPRILRVA